MAAEKVTGSVCGMFIFLPEGYSDYTCSKYKLVALLEKIQGLEILFVNIPLYNGR